MMFELNTFPAAAKAAASSASWVLKDKFPTKTLTGAASAIQVVGTEDGEENGEQKKGEGGDVPKLG